jgi:hypothetical protein
MELDEALVWIVLEGFGTAILIWWVTATLTIRLRGFSFRRAKEAPPPSTLKLPSIPQPQRTREEAFQDAALYDLVQTEHQKAKNLQDSTVAHLVSASLCLLAAFLGSVAAVTVLIEQEKFQIYAAALDVAALALVSWGFLRSGRLRTQWIRQRSRTEFLRQWSLVDFVLLPSNKGMTARYDSFQERVQDALRSKDDDVLDTVAAFGQTRIQEIDSGLEKMQSASVEALKFYLARRPLRQARWFASSDQRISRQHDHRRLIMLCLFIFALLAALAKFVVLVAIPNGAQTWANWAMFALLLFIGLTAASTSAYLGQNQRSLRHRYRAQLRVIDRWFETHKVAIQLARGQRSITGQELALLADAVVSFEEVMLRELVDWTAITTDDAMELAPA